MILHVVSGIRILRAKYLIGNIDVWALKVFFLIFLKFSNLLLIEIFLLKGVKEYVLNLFLVKFNPSFTLKRKYSQTWQ